MERKRKSGNGRSLKSDASPALRFASCGLVAHGWQRDGQLLSSRSSTSSTMAPTVEVMIALTITGPPIGGRWSTSHNQVPIYPPTTPTMMSPIRPKPVLFKTLAASHPAIAPTMSVTIKLSILRCPHEAASESPAGSRPRRRWNYGFFWLAQAVCTPRPLWPCAAQSRTEGTIAVAKQGLRAAGPHCTGNMFAAQYRMMHTLRGIGLAHAREALYAGRRRVGTRLRA